VLRERATRRMLAYRFVLEPTSPVLGPYEPYCCAGVMIQRNVDRKTLLAMGYYECTQLILLHWSMLMIILMMIMIFLEFRKVGDAYRIDGCRGIIHPHRVITWDASTFNHWTAQHCFPANQSDRSWHLRALRLDLSVAIVIIIVRGAPFVRRGSLYFLLNIQTI